MEKNRAESLKSDSAAAQSSRAKVPVVSSQAEDVTLSLQPDTLVAGMMSAWVPEHVTCYKNRVTEISRFFFKRGLL